MPDAICTHAGCKQTTIYARGMCRPHYMRWYRSPAGRAANPPPPERPCQQCGTVYRPRRSDGNRPSIYCSRRCKADAKNAAWKTALNEAKAGAPERRCPWCGDALPTSMRTDAVFCSAECNHAAHRTTRKFRRRLGQQEKRRYTEPLVTLAAIAERDGWRCQLCRRKVDRKRRHPDPLAASIDHVVPISAGLALGWVEAEINDPVNLQLSHQRCNWSKRDAAMAEQLRLIA